MSKLNFEEAQAAVRDAYDRRMIEYTHLRNAQMFLSRIRGAPLPPPTRRQRLRRWLAGWRERLRHAWLVLRTGDCDRGSDEW